MTNNANAYGPTLAQRVMGTPPGSSPVGDVLCGSDPGAAWLAAAALVDGFVNRGYPRSEAWAIVIGAAETMGAPADVLDLLRTALDE